MRGNTDRPVDILGNDEFQIEPYVTGMAEFIEECDTPMTIAIQGDWGCGKTSIMNMIRGYLKEQGHIVDVWFNTWQFSQFNMDDQLAITFLHHLIGELSNGIEDVDVKKKVVDKFAPIVKNITVGMTKQFIGSDIGEAVDNMLVKSKLDMVDELSELKANFEELVKKATGQGEKRVVVFIDDLDRLQPVRAVELLEILKLFVDCTNCVFVMAIDTSVVFQGIREKYGNDMSDEKAQSFFDKMIQMPFKMPVAYYRLESMMERLLDFLQEESLPKEDKKEYIALFKKVTNGNPRSLKRLANSILLQEKVAEKKDIYLHEPEDRQRIVRRIMVTLSCIQMKYESAYDFLVNDMTFKRMDTVLGLKLPKIDDSKRGEILINKMEEIGMSGVGIDDKLVFYDVINLYIRTLLSYIQSSGEDDISKKTAIEKLLKFVTLNNIVGGNDSLPKPAVEKNEENDTVGEDWKSDFQYDCLGKCVVGKCEEVYEQLTQRGLYLPLSALAGVSDIARENVKEMKKDIVPLEKYVLFEKIDTVLREYDTERKIDKTIYSTNVTYSKSFKGAYISVKLSYDQENRCLGLDSRVTDRNIKPMEATSVFVDKMIYQYGKVQEICSSALVKDLKENTVIKEQQDDGSIISLSFSGFPILNEAMADALIEYVIFVFQNMEDYYYQPASYNSGSADFQHAMLNLLSAAEGKPGES